MAFEGGKRRWLNIMLGAVLKWMKRGVNMETICCILTILLIIACIVIAKQTAMIKEMIPIINQIYEERHGNDD